MENFDDWTEVGGGDQNPVWDGDEGSVIVGNYTGKQTGVGPNKSMLYTLDTSEGPMSVWGSTVLDTKMENVPLHALVRIESLGKVQGKRGAYKDFKVMFKQTAAPAADANVAQVQNAAAQNAPRPAAEQAQQAMDVLGGEVV